MTETTTVKIPKVLADRVKEHWTYKEYGYTSVSSWILQATRDHLRMIINRMGS